MHVVTEVHLPVHHVAPLSATVLTMSITSTRDRIFLDSRSSTIDIVAVNEPWSLSRRSRLGVSWDGNFDDVKGLCR